MQRNNLTAEILRDLHLLGQKGLVMEMIVSSSGGNTLDDAAAIAEAVPELNLILDHFAGAYANGQAPSTQLVNGLKAVAKYPQVYVKVSGVFNQSVVQPAFFDPLYYKPLLMVLEDIFGTSRLIYGSNWPVSDLGGSFAEQQKLMLDYFQAEGDSVLNDVMWKNAMKFYHLPLPNVVGLKDAFPIGSKLHTALNLWPHKPIHINGKQFLPKRIMGAWTLKY